MRTVLSFLLSSINVRSLTAAVISIFIARLEAQALSARRTSVEGVSLRIGFRLLRVADIVRLRLLAGRP